MKTFINMLKDNSGAAAAEYALILAVVGAGIIVAAVFLGNEIEDVINCTAETINQQNDQC